LTPRPFLPARDRSLADGTAASGPARPAEPGRPQAPPVPDASRPRTPDGLTAGDPPPLKAVARADLHVHVFDSRHRRRIPPDLLARLVDERGLALVAVCEHDRIDVAVEAVDAAAGLGVTGRLVPGIEVTTRDGHLLGLFVERRIRRDRSLQDSVAEIHDAGGLAIVAHPLLVHRSSPNSRTIRAAVDHGAAWAPDGIEVFNVGSAALPGLGRRIEALAAELGLARRGGSDAHGP
jgi:predicted metal-dependent phosphoesterase TrpH